MPIKPVEDLPSYLLPTKQHESGFVTASPQKNVSKAVPSVSQSENTPPDVPALSVPTVILESDSIAAEMAACLANCLLNHVLFLKNQIPL